MLLSLMGALGTSKCELTMIKQGLKPNRTLVKEPIKTRDKELITVLEALGPKEGIRIKMCIMMVQDMIQTHHGTRRVCGL